MSAQAIQIEIVNQLDTNETGTAQFRNCTTITTNNNASGQFIANIVCRRISDGATQGWNVAMCYKNINGVVQAQIANQTYTKTIILGTSADKTALSATDVNFAPDGPNLQCQVKGLLSTPMIWTAIIIGSEVYSMP